MFDIISFGSTTVDILVKSDSISVEKNLPYDLLYMPKSNKFEMSSSLICSGGGATNTSVSFSRLGLKAACSTLFGTDPLSLYVLKDLKQDNVNLKYVVQDPGESTDYSVVLITKDGSRTIFTQRGSTCLDKKHVHWSKIKSRWFYISSLEGNMNLLEYLIGFAKENHIKIALNPGSRELNHPGLISLLPYVDFLLLNETESKILSGLTEQDLQFASKLKSFGPKIIAVTYGRLGAYIFSQNQSLFSPIINTDPVDELGAGDAFGSTFVSGLIMEKSLNQSLNMAIKNSASVVSHLGAKAGLLTLPKLLK